MGASFSLGKLWTSSPGRMYASESSKTCLELPRFILANGQVSWGIYTPTPISQHLKTCFQGVLTTQHF